MPGYLEDYGATDVQRERKIKRIVVVVAVLVIAVLTGYFVFRDYYEERQISRFVELLNKQDYRGAYGLWGCTEQKPCRDYAFEKFMEDWGPKGAHAGMGAGKLVESEDCGTGFIGTVIAGQDRVALWVEKKDRAISFAPWSECPERRFRLVKWLKMKFGS